MAPAPTLREVMRTVGMASQGPVLAPAVLRRALLLGPLLALAAPPRLAAQSPLRIAITPVLVEQSLDLNQRWVAYVGAKLGRPTQLLQRRSYKEISDLLEKDQVDVAFVCGLPYVLDHDRFGVELLVAPLVYQEPVYHSYVIVPADSPAGRFADLRGKRYAFSDPLSNSGHLVPSYMLARLGERADAFFARTIFTYSHSASVEAVAVKFVDGASVDSYVWDRLAATRPALTARTRIIERSPPHGITPIVVRRGVPAATKTRLRQLFVDMEHDPSGRALLAELMIRRFVTVPDRLYDSIRHMLRFVGASAPAARATAAPR